MKTRKKRFTSEKNARAFAEKVNGQLNDLRGDKLAKSKFSVSYQPSEKTKEHGKKILEDNSQNWAPEDGRDFGYPNEYWQ